MTILVCDESLLCVILDFEKQFIIDIRINEVKGTLDFVLLDFVNIIIKKIKL